jgi:hypothetical protein
VPTYEITFRDPARSPEIVDADLWRRERAHLVFYAVRLVVLTPYEVVARRFAMSEVASVRQLARGPAMISPDGYRVEQIVVQRSLRRPPRPYLRVTWRGHWVADCRSVAEVARYVDVSTLSEED